MIIYYQICNIWSVDCVVVVFIGTGTVGVCSDIWNDKQNLSLQSPVDSLCEKADLRSKSKRICLKMTWDGYMSVMRCTVTEYIFLFSP